MEEKDRVWIIAGCQLLFCFCFSIAPSIHFLRPLSAQFLRAFCNLSSSARIIAISWASTSQKLLLRREGNHYA
jgi:hypothetical protein